MAKIALSIDIQGLEPATVCHRCHTKKIGHWGTRPPAPVLPHLPQFLWPVCNCARKISQKTWPIDGFDRGRTRNTFPVRYLLVIFMVLDIWKINAVFIKGYLIITLFVALNRLFICQNQPVFIILNSFLIPPKFTCTTASFCPTDPEYIGPII